LDDKRYITTLFVIRDLHISIKFKLQYNWCLYFRL